MIFLEQNNTTGDVVYLFGSVFLFQLTLHIGLGLHVKNNDIKICFNTMQYAVM